MAKVTVTIDITTPTGRRLLRELEKYPNLAKVEYPIPPEIAGVQYTHEEVFGELVDKLNEHYGTNFKLKY